MEEQIKNDNAGSDAKDTAEPFVYYKAELIAEKSWMIKNAFMEPSYALCYLIEGDNYALLIDSILGFGNLKTFCETLTDKKIIVANTHSHSDHIGGNFFFDSCYIHHRDIASFQENMIYTKEQVIEIAKQMAPEEVRDYIKDDENFSDWKPMKVYPLYDGDVFDLGDRQIEVIDVGGHTAGSVAFIDHKTRIAYAGDACNGNTLLELPGGLPVITYLRNLLHLKEHASEFDILYCGHEILQPSIIDEAIETVSRVIAGTDARCERPGIMGGTVLYAAEKVEGGYVRVDGKHFNMSYDPERIFEPEEKRQIIKG